MRSRQQTSSCSSGLRAFVAATIFGILIPRRAIAHHEALFGPQSSLAVESPAFVSTQMHVHATGSGASYDQETTYILSAGLAPMPTVPWSITVIQPFTYESAHTPTGDGTGPFSSCAGCAARENLLVGTGYRFDFEGLQRSTGKDGNFALISASIEPPTGDKDYAAFKGPFNYVAAGLTGIEWAEWSTVALGYYRINAADSLGSKKGNNGLVGLGFAYTPVDGEDRMLSFQLGAAAEVHERDVLSGARLDASGGWEVFASPTVVWSPARHLRFFTLVSLPVAQSYRAPGQEDRWRAGLGVIYTFGHAQKSVQSPVAE